MRREQEAVIRAAEILNHGNVERAQVRAVQTDGTGQPILYRDHMFADQRALDEAFQNYYEAIRADSQPKK